MAGVVVDAEGKPVAAAELYYSDKVWKTHQTDSDGRFALDTRAPAIVIRKDGFRSEFMPTREAMDVRVVLQKLRQKRAFPICTDSIQYVGIGVWDRSFQFPAIHGVIVSLPVQDVDYTERSYYVKTKHGRKGIIHGGGPMWGLGIPRNEDISRSAKYYEETTYDASGIAIIDARGEFANGNRWRFLGMFGETASYSDVDEATAKLLDQVLDGACIKPVTPHPRTSQ